MTVGAIFAFRVKPEDNDKVVEVMRGIFDAMKEEEFPTGDVDTYTVYHDPADPGRWYMFEQFSDEGARVHAKGPLVRPAGQRLVPLCTEPYERWVLDPVLVSGCGEPIGTVHDVFEAAAPSS
jgi:quinol monooxygenase YgiN